MTATRWIVRQDHMKNQRLVFTNAEDFNRWMKHQAELAEMFPNHTFEFTVETEEYRIGPEV